jgi:hypothetical protein
MNIELHFESKLVGLFLGTSSLCDRKWSCLVIDQEATAFGLGIHYEHHFDLLSLVSYGTVASLGFFWKQMFKVTDIASMPYNANIAMHPISIQSILPFGGYCKTNSNATIGVAQVHKFYSRSGIEPRSQSFEYWVQCGVKNKSASNSNVDKLEQCYNEELLMDILKIRGLLRSETNKFSLIRDNCSMQCYNINVTFILISFQP